ncbi:hypothetical protein EXIGLDRAFT_718749, partial [Exidia glandulosa HHB12029]
MSDHPASSPPVASTSRAAQLPDVVTTPTKLPLPGQSHAGDADDSQGQMMMFVLDEETANAQHVSDGDVDGQMGVIDPADDMDQDGSGGQNSPKDGRKKPGRLAGQPTNSRRKEHTFWMCGYTDGGHEYKLVCGQLFNHQSNVYHHINKIHKEFSDVGRLVSMLDLRITDTFKCPGCRREFGREDSCRQHQRSTNHNRGWLGPVPIKPHQRTPSGNIANTPATTPVPPILQKWLCAFKGHGPEEDESAPECGELVMQSLGHLRAAHGVRHASNSYGRYVDMKVHESFRCAHCPCEFISRDATLHHAHVHAKEGLDPAREPTALGIAGKGGSEGGSNAGDRRPGSQLPSNVPYPDYDWQTIPPTRWPCIVRNPTGWPRTTEEYRPRSPPILPFLVREGTADEHVDRMDEVSRRTPPPTRPNLPPGSHPPPRHAPTARSVAHAPQHASYPPHPPPPGAHAHHHPPPHGHPHFFPGPPPPGFPPPFPPPFPAHMAHFAGVANMMPPPPPGYMMPPPGYYPGPPPPPPGTRSRAPSRPAAAPTNRAARHAPYPSPYAHHAHAHTHPQHHHQMMGYPPPGPGYPTQSAYPSQPAYPPPPPPPAHAHRPPVAGPSGSGSGSGSRAPPKRPASADKGKESEPFVPALPAAIPPVGMLIDEATPAPAPAVEKKQGTGTGAKGKEKEKLKGKEKVTATAKGMGKAQTKGKEKAKEKEKTPMPAPAPKAKSAPAPAPRTAMPL